MPLLVDVTKQAAVFLRYNDVNYLNVCNSRNMDSESIRLALLGAVRFGKPMVVDMMDIQYDISQLAEMLSIVPGKETLLEDIMSRKVLEEEYYLSLVDPEKDNPKVGELQKGDAAFILERKEYPNTQRALIALEPRGEPKGWVTAGKDGVDFLITEQEAYGLFLSQASFGVKMKFHLWSFQKDRGGLFDR